MPSRIPAAWLAAALLLLAAVAGCATPHVAGTRLQRAQTAGPSSSGVSRLGCPAVAEPTAAAAARQLPTGPELECTLEAVMAKRCGGAASSFAQSSPAVVRNKVTVLVPRGDGYATEVAGPAGKSVVMSCPRTPGLGFPAQVSLRGLDLVALAGPGCPPATVEWAAAFDGYADGHPVSFQVGCDSAIWGDKLAQEQARTAPAEPSPSSSQPQEPSPVSSDAAAAAEIAEKSPYTTNPQFRSCLVQLVGDVVAASGRPGALLAASRKNPSSSTRSGRLAQVARLLVSSADAPFLDAPSAKADAQTSRAYLLGLPLQSRYQGCADGTGM